MSLKVKALKGFFWTFFDQFGRTGLRFVVQLFLARLIAPDQFGLLGMIGLFYAVAESLSNAGINQSLIRMSKPKNIDYSTVFWLNMAISVFIYLLIFIAAPYIGEFYSEPILIPLIRVYSLSIVIGGFSSIQTTKFIKELNFKVPAMVNLPSIIISSILGIVLAYFDYGVWALVYMQVAQSLIASIQLWIRSNWKPSFQFSSDRSRYHLSFGYKLMLSGLANNIFINIYPMIIGKYNSASQVGFYTRALSFRSLPTVMLARIFGQVTFSILAEVKDNHERFLEIYSKFIKVLMLVTCFILFLFVAAAKPLILLLIGEKWLESVVMLQVIAVGGVFIILQSYLSNVLNVFGRSDYILKSLLYSRFINLLIILFTARMGIMPVIYGQVIAEIINVLVIQIYCAKLLKMSVLSQYSDFLSFILSGGLIAGIFLYCYKFLEEVLHNILVELLFVTVSFSILYFSAQYFINKIVVQELFTMRDNIMKRKLK